MLIGAAEVLRERGAAGVTIDEVLQRSGAPRGSVYYHFPEGRSQIVAEALEYAGESITSLIDEAAANGGRYLVQHFVDFWDRVLAESDFTAGCPVVAAAIGSAEPMDPNSPRWPGRSSGTGVRRSRAPSRSTGASRARPPRWPSRPSPHWRAPWCCAGPPGTSTRCGRCTPNSNSC
uniref:Transcriptional regulator, TetR family n=1 Tax=Mycobacterium sp. (strain MCS) TaxID=164756 RepID=A0A5Q5BDZ9_MYCSS